MGYKKWKGRSPDIYFIIAFKKIYRMIFFSYKILALRQIENCCIKFRTIHNSFSKSNYVLFKTSKILNQLALPARMGPVQG